MMMTKLEVFEARHNAFRKVDKHTFMANPKLRKVELSHNQISKIDHMAFKDVRSLEELFLSYNNISTIGLSDKLCYVYFHF